MRYYFLASGSAGNCTALVNDNNEIVLIDCGIAISNIKNRLELYGLSFDNVKNVVITHTHSDHILSVRAFNENIVYINSLCEMPCFNQYNYYDHLNLCGFDFYVLPASHDAPGTSAYLITYKDEKMAYITDTGYIHEETQMAVNNCDIYCVESNHDPRLLMLTNRPLYLKNRILGTTGHMSNIDTAYILANVMGPRTKEIVFLHRSREANTEEMIASTFMSYMNEQGIDLSNIKINIARQEESIEHGSINPLFYK